MLACIDVPALPLQYALRENPTWRDDAVVVVAEHKPQAPVLWTNKHAQRCRITRGMRFGAAQALNAKLRATVVSEPVIQGVVQNFIEELLGFSPRVEPSTLWPGVFWLDASGIESMFGTHRLWVQKIHQRFAYLGYVTGVTAGFTRFGVFALARSKTGCLVLQSKEKERALFKRVPLSNLELQPQLLEDLHILNVRTVGDFLKLPEHSLRIRYGEQAQALHRLANNKNVSPLQPKILTKPLEAHIQIEPPDDNSTRILFSIKRHLHAIIDTLADKTEAITALSLTLHLDHAGQHVERIETAGPTLNVVQLSDLIRLKLDSLSLEAPIEQIDIITESTRVHPQQISLLHANRRNLEAAARALARIKAMYGQHSVTQPILRDAILPEAKFTWRPFSELRYPKIKQRPPRLVRRVFERPRPLPDIPQHETARWLGHHGPVEHMHGPYRVQGGWWAQQVRRDYYFVETRTHELLWIYHDHERRRWMLHGVLD